ncbi:SUKH-3 domain-containing protein [Yinghuangia aomiensis]
MPAPHPHARRRRPQHRHQRCARSAKRTTAAATGHRPRPAEVFAIDHTGEWFLGDSLDAALTTLVLGTARRADPPNGAW